MDRFTRNYAIGLGVAVLAALGLWIYSTWSPGASALNRLLEADRQLAEYPYPFRVESLKDGVATIKSPRSFEVPVIQFLGVLYPRLANRPANDPETMAAQNDLAAHQKRAQQIVQSQPQVRSVRWSLDRDWYAARGQTLPPQ
jgi:hypothetical protein